MNHMQTPTRAVLFAVLLFIATGCGNSAKDSNANLNDKKAALEKLKNDKTKTEDAITKLQDELAKIDTASANSAKVKLVAVTPVSTQNFQHFIDLQGKVDADNISYISPKMGPAQVKGIYVHEGQSVKKGQLLLKLEDAVLRQQIVASRQQLEGIKTQLSFARNIYQRQKNLWDQGIGTEVQLITAKTNTESLENQLKSAEEQVKVAVEQLNTSNVYSDVSGIADIVSVKVGEIFQGMTATGPQIKIVNTSSLKVVSNIPENYLTRVHKGSMVDIVIPDANKKLSQPITLISQSIDATTRGFITEAKIPYDASLKPNQAAILHILDYSSPNAIVISINAIQSDESGKYVFVMEKLSNGKNVASRKTVLIGEVYGNNAEIKGGLVAGDQLVTEGYQSLYQGQLIATELK